MPGKNQRLALQSYAEDGQVVVEFLGQPIDMSPSEARSLMYRLANSIFKAEAQAHELKRAVA